MSNKKLDMRNIKAIVNMLWRRIPLREIAKMYSVSYTTIYNIKVGKSYPKFKGKRPINLTGHPDKTTPAKAKRILSQLKKGISQRQIALNFGVSQKVVHKIKHRRKRYL